MRQTNNGGALLTALFIMTLVAIVATAMSVRVQSDIYRTRLVVTHDKLYLASQAVTFWAMNELSDKNNQFTKVFDKGFVSIYPKNMVNLEQQIQITGGLYDLQAQFNLNNAGNKKAQASFANLLGLISPIDTPKKSLAQSLNYWLSTYDPSQIDESDLSYYLKQKPPYYPSNMLMQSHSEFRLLQDVNAEQYLNVEPFITVLPEPNTPVNINTASKQVLMSLGSGLSEIQANEIIMARGENGINNLKEITEITTKTNIPLDQITIESQYFLSFARVSLDEFNLVVYTLLKRNRDKNNKLSVSLIRESFRVY